MNLTSIRYPRARAATIEQSLLATKRRGTCVLYGSASGPVGILDTSLMQQAGSITFVRPGLADYLRGASEYRTRTSDLFEWHRAGALQAHVGAVPFKGVGAALTQITSGATTGNLLIRP